MSHSIAFGWINQDISRTRETDRDHVHRLADRLGYHLVWPGEHSVLRVADQARNARADLVILPAPDHLCPHELDAVLDVCDAETVLPRLSFPRWTSVQDTP
ncbi:hypothetical protein ACPESR_17085 [Nocardia testacea]|uniref:hypothetical protein n=1 Tax=Nocardia testacea TaxID=248551 RepID=UPI003C2CCDB1